MKKTLLLFIVLTVAIQAQWKTLLTPGIPSRTNDISFVSSTEGYAATDSAEACLYKTTDAGKTWLPVKFNTTYNSEKVVFKGQKGWVLGKNSAKKAFLNLTKDGGKTWTEVPMSNVLPGYTVVKDWTLCFPSETIGYALISAYLPPALKVQYYYILKTEDGGMNWKKTDSLDGTGGLVWMTLNFANPNKGVVVGNKKNTIKYTANGGKTWTLSTPTDADLLLQTVAWADSNTVMAMGDGFSASKVYTPTYRSTDGGKTWTKIAVSTFGKAKMAYFKNSLEGIAMGPSDKSSAFVTSTTDGGKTWKEIPQTLSGSMSVFCPVNNEIIALSAYSQVLKSADGCKTWSYMTVNGTGILQTIQSVEGKVYSLNSIGEVFSLNNSTQKFDFVSASGLYKAGQFAFVDANNGCMVKESRQILQTNDGGKTWSTSLDTILYNSNNKAYAIRFIDKLNGFALTSSAGTKNALVHATTDGGKTWLQVHSSTLANTPTDMGFFDATTGLIIGDNLSLLISKDGGKTWNPVTLPNEIALNFTKSSIKEICVVDANTAYFIADKVIFKTADKGTTYSIVDLKPATGADDAYFTGAFSGSNGVIGTFNGSIFITKDGGKTWETDLTHLNKLMFYAAAADKGMIYLGSNNGVIIGKEFVTGVENEKTALNDYKLFNNYPNPFNPSTQISFNLPKSEQVTLTVYNSIGKEVARLINGKVFSAGQHSVEFNASGLPSGLYLCRMEAGSFNAVNKIMLIK